MLKINSQVVIVNEYEETIQSQEANSTTCGKNNNKKKVRNDMADVLTSDTSIILQGNIKNESDLVCCMAHTHNCYHLLVLIVIHLKVTTHKEQMCSIATRKVVFVRN